MTGEEREDIVANIDSLQETIRGDENLYESKITVLSASGMTLALTFAATYDNVTCKALLIAGLTLSGASLIYNMALHFIGKKIMREKIAFFIQCIDKDKFPYPPPRDILQNVSNRIDKYNLINVIIMGAGLIGLVTFVCINLF